VTPCGLIVGINVSEESKAPILETQDPGDGRTQQGIKLCGRRQKMIRNVSSYLSNHTVLHPKIRNLNSTLVHIDLA
jgi:hypothetical protein